jgi:hypothetical protein
MRNYLITFSAVLMTVLLIASGADAAPGLRITRPPVVGPPNTGPLVDPPSTRGQWFWDLHTNQEQYRQFEFYDNVIDYGGGWRSWLAIEGYIIFLNYDALGNITDFYMQVTIWNDMPGYTPWEPGSNSHSEYRPFFGLEEQEWQETMLDVKWAASFADNWTVYDFPLSGPPYFPAPVPLNWIGSIESNICATPWDMESGGYDQLAWYCWTPSPTEPSPGQYMVPTWDFGDIPPGGSSTRVIHFYLRMPVGPRDLLFTWLTEMYQKQYDVLLNRTTSLKISQYFDLLYPDFGVPYPVPPESGSDCSVFFNLASAQPPVIDDVFRNPNNTLTITWTGGGMTTYTIESSTMPYDPNYNEAAMVWVIEASGMGMTSWTDPFPPPGPFEKYYRVYASIPWVGIVYGPDTVGARSAICNPGRNLVSSPLEPYPDGGLSGGGTMGIASLNKIVGNQLTGHGFNQALSDTIEIWNNITASYSRAWFDNSPLPGTWVNWGGGAPVFGINADKGYWLSILTGHPPKKVVLCGRVSKVNRFVPISIGRNLVGSCFPVSCPLSQSNLVGSGFTGHGFNKALSDNVEFWNNPMATYERFWFDTTPGPGSWQPWITGQPLRIIMPGDGIWVNVLTTHSPFAWTYLVPPRPAFAP